MSYQVLARKWRPRQFQDMVGQESILRMLSNALDQNRLHHAYLFTGTRGVGKTTLGRILAKCLNCETGVTSKPCNTCHACVAIDNGQFLDLYEVDAASRTKVEDTRELLDNVLYPPTQGRYKIYLIDEVHMLSNHSFNALLKTLEEPPQHVKFLLATTDPKRLPITILSRCLQFHLKHITAQQISQHLTHICGVENIQFEAEALEKLAHAADGSMRDALSLLDQAIAYSQGHLTKNDIIAMLGNMSQEDLIPLVNAIAKQNAKEAFQCILQLAEYVSDFNHVFEELIALFHQIAIAQVIPDQVHDEKIKQLTNAFSPEEIQLYYQIALLGRRDLGLSPRPQQGFEMSVLRMLAFKPSLGITETPASNDLKNTNSDDITQPTISIAVNQTDGITAKNEPSPMISSNLAIDALSANDLEEDEETPAFEIPVWRDFLPKLELTGMAYALASNCMLQKVTGNKIYLALSTSHQPMLNSKLKERIASAMSRELKQAIQLEIKVTTEEIFTPVKQSQHEKNERLSEAKESILSDPKIQQLIKMYDATIDVSLV